MLQPTWRVDDQNSQALRSLLSSVVLRNELDAYVNALVDAAIAEIEIPEATAKYVQWYIPTGDSVVVTTGGQYIVYDEFKVDGSFQLDDYAQLMVTTWL